MTASIVAEGIGKRYVIKHGSGRYRTLREDVMSAVFAPVRLLSRTGGGTERGRPRDDFWAVRDLTFEVAEGEVFGIIGRNGAGKSTLLKILSRIIQPTEGRARVRGRVGTLLEVGAGFHPELTGRDNVYLSGAILGMSRREIARQFDEIVEFSGIERFLDTPVKRYSSGMYLRLGFSVAAHLEADILVVDEVLAVGDAEFQQKCLGRMEEVAGNGRTVLFVSHNLAAVHALCSRAGVLEGGRFVQFGDVEECIRTYRNWGDEAANAVVSFPSAGDAGLRMTSAALLADSRPATRVFMGAALALEVAFECDPPVRLPYVGFMLHGKHGETLLSVNNRYQASTPYASAVSSGLLRMDLGVLPLVAGRYSITLLLGDMASDTHIAEHALMFEVIERDIWGTGQVPEAQESHMWWPTTFHMLPARAPGGAGG
ncbi:MAG: teichoic acid export ATP-binding protein TagH [Gemmatimonadetes bacterium]|nr:teichoic acid export ATP-binding protein TagH [Gemmatimonadota bacterium]